MRTTLLTTIALLALLASITFGQEQAKTPPAEANGLGKNAAGANVEFRWLERAHEDGLTDAKEHQTICPDCSANHARFAHKDPLGVARHMTGISPHPAVRTRSAVELTINDEGIDAIAKSAAKVKKYVSLGVFVGGEFVGVLSQRDRPKNRPVVLLPSAEQVRRLYAASNVAGLVTGLESPTLLARFRFDGDMKDSSGKNTAVTVKNAIFKENALYVNGKYDGNPDEAERALTCRIRTPSMSDTRFVVAMRFKAFRLRDPEYRTILCGGAERRWFRLASSERRKLTVSLNDGRSRHQTSVEVKTREWYTVVCEFDLGARLLQIRVNGKDLKPIKLTADGIRGVPDSEKVWSFASNAKSGSVFHGLVDELVVYDGAFWPHKSPGVLIDDKSGKKAVKAPVSSDEKPK